jgi:hypothetical protein
MRLKTRSVKGFAGGGCAAQYSGSAVDAIAASSIVATRAVKRRDASSVEPQISVTGELQEGG